MHSATIQLNSNEAHNYVHIIK